MQPEFTIEFNDADGELPSLVVKDLLDLAYAAHSLAGDYGEVIPEWDAEAGAFYLWVPDDEDWPDDEDDDSEE